jgi:hypothetical protein
MKLTFHNPDQVRLEAQIQDDRDLLKALVEDKLHQHFRVVSWSPYPQSTGPRFVDKQPHTNDPSRPNEPAAIASEVNRVWFYLMKVNRC